MSNYLRDMIQQIESLSLSGILVQVVVAFALGLVIYLSYFLTHSGTIYSRKFNTSLIILAILTTVVMTAIGNNIALSLGMVGALSIVRFRTAIKDSRDTVYIFWSVVVGLTCGVGDYTTAGVGSALAFLVLLVMGRVKNENRVILIVRGHRNESMQIMATVSQYFDMKMNLRVKNTTQETVELIYEVPRKTYDKAIKRTESIEELIYQIGNIDYVNVVMQDDDISG